MNSSHHVPNERDTTHRALTLTRVSDTEWHAVQADQVVGRGDASRRPDGRLFVSIDAWHDTVFDRIAHAMLADLPAPLHTLVDESDHATASAWQRAGFTTARRDQGYLVPTDPQVTGLLPARPPAGVTIVPAAQAEQGPLRALERVIHDEVEACAGWQSIPAQVLPRPAGTLVVDPAQYAVARQHDRYVGLIRVSPPRRPRIGLIAVRAELHRHGIARALLAHALEALHRDGTTAAWAEVAESNTAATALLEGIGARHADSTLELVRR
ncbi:GNAT family N-acetyltransferase [Kitasatospora cathayae]|uniref:GNAT family N-acetyltransferase n=1 Tax=Kitasatospora cathayae TaxID=3004092 RepID=A0ABY7QER6_9ACTN|nr:GNAT family N-acetyltransferase [Kitasatospora sp. HUAS 3-15]WBP91117.1 GNAT family N-acetyltransferase [Kitasatospora sp. HUAS 3-15]